jgi:ankyrin repeat protein
VCDWSLNNVLHFAAESGPTEFVAYLLDTKQMDIECCNSHQKTPLWLAAQSGRLQVTDLLLKHNANLHVKDKDGCTPLEAATACGHLEVAQLLLERGASMTASNAHH